MTTIYLISNNITNNNSINDKNNDNIEFKLKNKSLNYEGINAAIKISNLKNLKNTNYIFSSSYNTSLETSNYLSKKLNRKVRIDNRLNLRKIGITKLSELPNYYNEQSFLDINYKLPKGESQEEVRERMYNFINYILDNYNNKKIIILTHNICIIYLLRIWCNIKYKENIIYKGNIISSSINKDPNIYKLEFNNKNITAINYISLD